MAYNAVNTTTQVTQLLETQYRKRFSLDTTERMVIASAFEDATEGLQKLGNAIVLRKIAPKAAQTGTATSAMDPTGLTWEQDTEQAVTVSPTFRYCAYSLNKPAQTRLLADAEFKRGVREQMTRGLAEAIDLSAGDLASSLNTNIVGSGAVNLDQSLILEALGKLRIGAGRYFELGETKANFCVHPKQLQHLFAISNYMNAQFRGQDNGPVATGVVVPGWGVTIKISGNVDDSGGALHNFMHVGESHVIGWNEKPKLLPEQPYGLDLLLIAFAEAGVAEFYDAYAVDVQTSNA